MTKVSDTPPAANQPGLPEMGESLITLPSSFSTLNTWPPMGNSVSPSILATESAMGLSLIVAFAALALTLAAVTVTATSALVAIPEGDLFSWMVYVPGSMGPMIAFPSQVVKLSAPSVSEVYTPSDTLRSLTVCPSLSSRVNLPPSIALPVRASVFVNSIASG